MDKRFLESSDKDIIAQHMQQPQMPTERTRVRKPSFHPCLLSYGTTTIPVIAKEYSDQGARLAATGLHLITTDTALLASYIFGHVRVRIVWRDIDLIGVEFL